jgi:mRNA interferase MazF
MVVRRYVPDAGDLVWLSFDPRTGHEQRGRRPALILSPRAYNEKARLALACPITSRIKGYPFEVPLAASGEITGVVLADQVKSLDWHERKAAYVASISGQILDEVRQRLRVLIGV